MDFNLTAGTRVLERTPGTLRAMLAGLPPEWTDATEGPDTWSPYVIVGHLIHGERTDWIPRARERGEVPSGAAGRVCGRPMACVSPDNGALNGVSYE